MHRTAGDSRASLIANANAEEDRAEVIEVCVD